MPTPLTAAILSDALADLTARDPRLARIVAGSAAGVRRGRRANGAIDATARWILKGIWHGQ